MCFYNNPNTKIKPNLNKSNHQHTNIGLSYNDKKQVTNSRNNKNDFNLFYNRTSNNINADNMFFQDIEISGIKNKNNLSNYAHKKFMNKNNSTNQIKNKKLQINNYLYNINKDSNNFIYKNKRNDSYILNNSNKNNLLKSNHVEHKNKSINYTKNDRKVTSNSIKNNNINNININSYINNGETYKKQRTNSGMNGQMSINNYINVNINNNNNKNENIKY